MKREVKWRDCSEGNSFSLMEEGNPRDDDLYGSDHADRIVDDDNDAACSALSRLYKGAKTMGNNPNKLVTINNIGNCLLCNHL